MNKGREGIVFTPPWLVDYMVEKLFSRRPPSPWSKALDPGCGMGAFIDGILRWCEKRGLDPPRIVGVEINSGLASACRVKYRRLGNVEIIQGDFLLLGDLGRFDYVVGNPPYISIEKLSPELREKYKKLYKTATGRFDVYMLFIEKALRLLNPGGRLVFVTPEKYLYVHSARALRKLLARYHVEEVELLGENTFKGVQAYPAITVVNKEKPSPTVFIFRDGTRTKITLPKDGSPWLGIARASRRPTGLESHRHKLGDIVVRISAGVATGRDRIFVIKKSLLPAELKPYAWPTISGEELSRFRPWSPINYSKLQYVMLIPYDKNGKLLNENDARPLIKYLERYRKDLESRRVVTVEGKQWYAFHENPPMKHLTRPKILWRDIEKKPQFWIDPEGLIVPRHNVYYMVPRNPQVIPDLIDYLNTESVKRWIEAHAQRAANGYLRLQASLLRNLPIPESLYLKGLGITSLGN